MSLFNIKSTGGDLDSVFANSATFATVSKPPQTVPAKAESSKRKADEISSNGPADSKIVAPAAAVASINADGTMKRKAGKKERPPKPSKEEKLKLKAAKAQVEEQDGSVANEIVEDIDEDEALQTAMEQFDAPENPEDAVSVASGQEDVEEDEQPASSKQNKKVRTKKVKYVPEGETSQDRDRRTLFIGNVAVETMKQKSLQSQLKQLLLSIVPTASIESLRFRSIAFAAPTVSSADAAAATQTEEEKEKTRREERERLRVSAWKEEHGDDEQPHRKRQRRGQDSDDDDEQNGKKDGKVFFKPGEKRRVAFYNQEFHKDVATANAYVVFAHPAPDRPTNVRPIMNPYEAVETLLQQATSLPTFQDRHLRLDSVRPTLESISAAAAAEGKSTLPARRQVWTAGKDVKCSLFVGNVDFNATEEDLRLFFEGLVEKERGKLEAGQAPYVEGVRIVRDRETQMAKGFAYVAFKDRESVDEVLALKSDKLKYAKRYLRVEQCKTLPSALGGRDDAKAKAAAAAAAASKTSKAPGAGKQGRSDSKPIKKPIVPAVLGDPTLGSKIAAMSKEDRKAFKSSDPTRLARRAAKKQSAKLKEATAGKRDKVKLDVKGTSKKLAGGREKSKAKKSRVRSENAAKKVKGKRD